MKSIAEIVAEKRLTKEKKKDQKVMTHSFDSSSRNSGRTVSSDVQSALRKMGADFTALSEDQQEWMLEMFGRMTDQGMKMANVGEITNAIEKNKPSLSIPIHLSLPEIDIETTNITGLEDFFEAFLDEIRNIRDDLRSIKIEVPTINVPEPKVTVNVPEIKIPEFKIPKPEVKINQPALLSRREMPLVQKDKPVSRVVSEMPIYEDGKLVGYVEEFSDGTKHTERMTPSGGIKHTYA